jgi:hypothetical protein
MVATTSHSCKLNAQQKRYFDTMHRYTTQLPASTKPTQASGDTRKPESAGDSTLSIPPRPEAIN